MAAPQPVNRQDTFDELDVVRLRSFIYADEILLPAGTIGTVVFRHLHGEAYEVEFDNPVSVVLTLRTTDMEASK